MRKLPTPDAMQEEIQRLREAGVSFRKIAERLGIGLTTARKYGGSTNAPPRSYDPETIAKQAKRCPVCGRKTVPPCAACAAERNQDR